MSDDDVRELAQRLAARAGIEAPRIRVVGGPQLTWRNARIDARRSEIALQRQLLGLGWPAVAAALAHELGHAVLY